MERIVNPNQRKVCLCKRKKGLLKKAIELSVLCDLEIFMLVYDKQNSRVTHYASNEEYDMLALFNNRAQREFFSNFDYCRVGGSSDEIDSKYVPTIPDMDIEAFSDTEGKDGEKSLAGMSSQAGGTEGVSRKTF